jgi:virginiamycin B lyase
MRRRRPSRSSLPAPLTNAAFFPISDPNRRLRRPAALTASFIATALLLAGCAGEPSTGATSPSAPSASVASLAPASTAPASAGPTPSHRPVGSPTASAASVPSVGSIVPESTFDADVTVGTMLAADGAVWVFDWSGVTRIDPATNQARRFELQGDDGSDRPGVLGAVGSGSIWVSDFDLGQVRRYDEKSGALTATISTPNPEGLLFDKGALWIGDHRSGSVSRLDPKTDRVVATVKVGSVGPSGPERLIAAGGRIWAGIPRDLDIAGIDPAANKAAGTIPITFPGNPCGDLGSFGDRLYVSGCASVQRLGVVDIRSMKAVDSPAFDGHVTAPVTVADGLWLGVTGAKSELTALDPLSLKTGRTVSVSAGAPTLLLVANKSLWVSIEDEPARKAWVLRLPLSAFE